MAEVIDNDIMAGLSGRLGKRLVLRHMRDGRTFVLTRPDFSNRVFSQGQLTHQSRFQQAAAYARLAARTNPLYAKAAAGTSKSAYNLALSDWFHSPVIRKATRQAGHIRVEARDNFLVTEVRITILDQAGMVLEQGQAGQTAESDWEYTGMTEGTIRVEAFDLAGNVTRQELGWNNSE